MKRIILVLILLAVIPLVYAEQVCCEKTIDNQFCIFTDVSNCNPSFKTNAASCEQTSYCRIGCCFSSDEGQCFKNTPEAACTQKEYVWDSNADCNNVQCTKGCCTLGPESFFVTKTKCKQVTSQYEDVSMSFDDSVNTEKECLDKSRSQDLGCCVTEDSCSFTTRENCNVADKDIDITYNETTEGTKIKEGFYSGTLCSNDRLGCGCAKQHHTECFGEDVYWFDSCGNRENIYDKNKAVSYNKGYVLTESQSCQDDDIGCGNCDYLKGTLCGNATKNNQPQYGDLVCKSTDCKNTYTDKYSPNSGGQKKSGESWCLYDGPVGEGKDLVGSLHYRALCINGEEIIEPCKDFREEICIQNARDESPPSTLQSFGIKEGYTEAACRENRWESCNQCNEIETCGADCDGLPDPNLDTEDNEAVRACCAKKCCEDEINKDCFWAKYGISPFLTKSNEGIREDLGEQLKQKPAEGSKRVSYNEIIDVLNGVCVSQVPPGIQFWNSEVEPVESSTRATTRAITEITGRAEEDSEFLPETPSSKTTLSTSTSSAGDVCSEATIECTVRFKKGLFERLWGTKYIAGSGYTCLENCHCTTKEWVIAANNFCKSKGDCGAYFNVLGDYSMDGYSNDASSERIYFGGYNLKVSDLGNWKELSSTKEDKDFPGFFSQLYEEPRVFLPLIALTASSMPCLLDDERSFADCLAFGGLRSFFGKGPYEKTTYKFSKNKLYTEEQLKEQGIDIGEKYVPVKKLQEEAGIEIEGKHYFLEEDGTIIGGTTNNYQVINPNEIDPELRNMLFSKEAEVEGFVYNPETGKYRATKNIEVIEGGGVLKYVNLAATLYLLYYMLDKLGADEVEKTYTATCELWQPPNTDKCEECNNQKKPCTEYKCRSLGSTCAIINEGTSKQLCINMDPNDVISPSIEPLKKVLDKGLTITKSSNGYKINERIKPFKKINLGIQTNEPSQCRFSDERNIDFDEMPNNFGDPSYKYEHEALFMFPEEAADNEVLQKTAGGVHIIYVKCKDASGNKNGRDYFIKFQVDPTPDLTPPVIEETSIDNNIYIPANIEETEFSIFVNEPATCKYSNADQDYERMESEFSCSQSVYSSSALQQGLYECETKLKNLQFGDNTLYIKCKDDSNNINQESYPFTLKGTRPLHITSMEPSGTFFIGNITLKVKTKEGAEQGVAVCAFESDDVSFEQMVKFLNTDSTTHTQPLTLQNGNHDIFIKCRDSAGNQNDTKTSIIIQEDNQPPRITNIYKDLNILHITVDEYSVCEYSIKEQFTFGSGTPMTGSQEKHELSIDETSNKYYIKCKDKFDNIMSAIIYI